MNEDEYNTVTCLTCDHKPEFDVSEGFGEFKKHLRETHGIKELKGSRHMLAHFDGTYCEWIYELRIGDVEASHNVRYKRQGR